MSAGRIYSTPWGRAAIGAYLPGGLIDLAQRIPPGHTLSVSARSAHGPWQVVLSRVRGNATVEVFRASPNAAQFPAAVAAALEVIWP